MSTNRNYVELNHEQMFLTQEVAKIGIELNCEVFLHRRKDTSRDIDRMTVVFKHEQDCVVLFAVYLCEKLLQEINQLNTLVKDKEEVKELCESKE